jgi:phage tail tape-measure protein
MHPEQNSETDAADQIGEAAGGISGVVTGAALGSVAGPIGTLIGGIAGAVGGWWAGREIAEKASELAHDDAGREFDEIEVDLRRGVADQPDDPTGGWTTGRDDRGRAADEQ